MGRKSKKQKALELLRELNQNDLQDIQEFLDTFNLGSTDNSFANVEPFFDKLCPDCGSPAHVRKGKTRTGLTSFLCKDCGRRFTILSETPMDKTPYEWKVWVTVLEKMLTDQSILTTRDYLIRNHTVDGISEMTVSAMMQKLRTSFISMPLPTLEGIIQVDEKHFRESQKGVKDPNDVLNLKGGTRKGRHRPVPSKYGTMGPEFSTICCAVDENGHSVAKVVKMGHMREEDFEDEIAPHFGSISWLCSDMNSVYLEWSSLNKVNHYIINSQYHKIIAELDTPTKKQAAYEQNKLEYTVGAGVMSYQQMVRFRTANNLTINAVNGYHSGLERYINRIAKGVSTKHLQAWVSFYNYRNNFRVDNGYTPSTYEDAEVILIELLKLRNPMTVKDILSYKDLTKQQPRRYTRAFVKKTIEARVRSNDPYIKFMEDDGVWIVDKRRTLNLLPEYKVRLLARSLKIKPFSPTSVSLSDLKKKILAHPDTDNMLYVLASGHEDDKNL